VHVVVATPGRILDLANKGVCKLNNCRCLVMDEVGRPAAPLYRALVAALC
jgi:ATP-dependent RNA helicase DDX6/DHH1